MRTRATRRLSVLAAVIGLTASSAMAQDAVTTRVMVRVTARDAKIIGSGVGGAKVTIVNAATGAVLAEGVQKGGTGRTDLIMSTPRERGMTLYDTEGAAGFLAELQLSAPTVVNVSAVGPLEYPQAMRSASKQILLVPGQDMVGEGVTLELHGFIVEILTPEPLDPVGEELEVKARVRMMCGCTITPEGMWDADVKSFLARLKANGRVIATAELEYAGDPSVFEGTIEVPASARGDLTVEVIVGEVGTYNFGRHEIPVGRRE